MGQLIKKDKEYQSWFLTLKKRIKEHQLKAFVSVNSELIRTYWGLGKDIVEQQADAKWGSGFFEELSKDLKDTFPNISGFSVTNLKYMKRVYLFYNQSNTKRHQAGADLENLIFQIPWRHQVEIVSKTNNISEAMFYMQKTLENNWSRSVLMNILATNLFEAQGKEISNFKTQLPDTQGDLAQEITKDPYNFGFLALTENYREKELEDALVDNITKFLLELGNGFAYVGRQVRLEIGEEEFFADLLFYHLKLRCFVVVELKTGKFKAEYVSKLGLYVSAINHQMRHENDAQTIGLLICKSKDDVVAQYTLESTTHPIGISEYQLSKVLSKEIESNLPSIKAIEDELKS
ncbi:PDDEXK nuclease domain-containing protein [Aquimarina longa]|uniref:PDDEXK nuclease domain-containing protein n=1 Tax=Aquimarina longa TaxID=1080221 RepID=UPI0007826674|nr:PDDEXK nuclease domain-containing protein [Aquimarina longa]